MRSIVNYTGENNFSEEEKKYYNKCFDEIEDHKYMSDSSVEESSDEELSDEELGEELAVK